MSIPSHDSDNSVFIGALWIEWSMFKGNWVGQVHTPRGLGGLQSAALLPGPGWVRRPLPEQCPAKQWGERDGVG